MAFSFIKYSVVMLLFVGVLLGHCIMGDKMIMLGAKCYTISWGVREVFWLH